KFCEVGAVPWSFLVPSPVETVPKDWSSQSSVCFFHGRSCCLHHHHLHKIQDEHGFGSP
ncbi:unnamed protein product, partial [Musa acuminata var. zebrina]